MKQPAIQIFTIPQIVALEFRVGSSLLDRKTIASIEGLCSPASTEKPNPVQRGYRGFFKPNIHPVTGVIRTQVERVK